MRREGGLVKTCPWNLALRTVGKALAHTRPPSRAPSFGNVCFHLFPPRGAFNPE